MYNIYVYKLAFIRNLQVISAKVPIIKFHDSLKYNCRFYLIIIFFIIYHLFSSSIDCDININNHIGIRNVIYMIFK